MSLAPKRFLLFIAFPTLVAVSGACRCHEPLVLVASEPSPPELANTGEPWTSLSTDAGLACLDTDGDGHGVGPGCLGPDCDDGDARLGEDGARRCYTGPAGTEGKGVCAAGTQRCQDGVLGECEGQVLPGTESCDLADNDCDGDVDEQLTRTCYTGPDGTEGVGACGAGTQTCVGGVFADCADQRLPSAERCDDLDNDCDGAVDEEVSRSCYSGPAGTAGIGACLAGTQRCAAGAFGACEGEVTPGAETCDALDNDCDGAVDEALVRSCYDGEFGTAGMGLCAAGLQTCANGEYGACTGQTLPRPEACDNQDNDCDGQVDEALVRSCYGGPGGTEGVGLCAAGTETCTAGSFGACVGEVRPAAETCDAQDNDCDGETDEALQRACYSGPSGTEGVGLCAGGTQSCVGGAYGTCEGEIIPSEESCDAQDNDCDGQADEELVRACYSGPAGTEGVGVCAGGTQRCVAGAYGACEGERTPLPETCDDVDEDCDGQTDDGVTRACYSGDPGTEGVGICAAGTQSCVAGVFGACEGDQLPAAETCDAQDNNCNGQTDEHVTRYSRDGSEQAVNPLLRPVDVIFVVDNSGSMTEEIISIQDNISANFADLIARSGIDYRVIFLSKHGAVAASQSICIRSPLSGNGDCTVLEQCPVNTSRFFHYSAEISTHDSFWRIVSTYNEPDECGLAPNGWSAWLRPGAAKVFIEFTDSGPTPGNPDQENSLTADTFEHAFFRLRPAMFGTATARAYTFHTIAGLKENAPPTEPWLPTQPLVEDRCTGNGGHVVDDATEYQKVSIRTGGLRYPICEYQSYDAVFREIARGIIVGSQMECGFSVASTPPDSSMANAYIEYIPSGGGAPVVIRQVADAAACSGDAFWAVGTDIHLCPGACLRWRDDPAGRMDVLFTCTPQLP